MTFDLPWMNANATVAGEIADALGTFGQLFEARLNDFRKELDSVFGDSWKGEVAAGSSDRWGQAYDTMLSATELFSSAAPWLLDLANTLARSQGRISQAQDLAAQHSLVINPDGTVTPPDQTGAVGDTSDAIAAIEGLTRLAIDDVEQSDATAAAVMRTAAQEAVSLIHLDDSGWAGFLVPESSYNTLSLLGLFNQHGALPGLVQQTDQADSYDPLTNLLGNGQAGRDWSSDVMPKGACLPGGAAYGGGGYVRGPDGNLYPLVIPSVVGSDGQAYNASADGSGDGVLDLDGADGGWMTTSDTVGDIDNTDGGFLKGAAVVADGSASAHGGKDTPEYLKDLTLNPDGTADLDGEHEGEWAEPRDYDDRERSKAELAPQVQQPNDSDGELRADPTDRQPSLTVHPTGAEPEGSDPREAVGGVTLIPGVTAGLKLGNSVGEPVLDRYQLITQVNQDGRTRAILTLNKVSTDATGNITPWVEYIAKNPDGSTMYVPQSVRP